MSSPRTPVRKIQPIRFKRRDLLKVAQIGGVAGAAAALGLGGREAHAEKKVEGVCRICTMHCGVVATTRGDRLIRVEGDKKSTTRGFICHHGQALREVVHSDHRLRRPLRRDGASFVEVSWEEALKGIAERLGEVKERFGARALALQTGWPFVRHPLIRMMHRFCRAFGTPNLGTIASMCEASARMGNALVTGSNTTPDLAKVRTLVVWGANPPVSSPPFGHIVASKSFREGRLIVIDPIRTDLAARATMHLRIRPGTDGALALGLIHLILKDGLCDRAAAERDTLGLAELEALAAEYPPSRVRELTGIEPEVLSKLARTFATDGPSAVWKGLGIEHHENGVQTVRAVNALEAICGYVGAPGGAELLRKAGPRFYDEPLPALYRMRTPEPVPPEVSDKPIGYEEYPVYDVYNRQAQANLFARAMLEDRPYPLRALILFGANPLVTSPGSERLARAYDKLELLVTIDPFLTATGERSDYVLPASTFAEAPGVIDDDERVARSGIVQEQHDSWPDWKVLFELARALRLGRYFPWSTLSEALDAPAVEYLRDPAHQPRPDPAPAGTPPPRFPTITGKLELESTVLERFGYPALPVWTPPSERPTPDFPLILVSGPRTHSYMNSQFRKIPSIVWQQPAPLVELHPETARKAGIVERDEVRITSPRGAIVLTARLTDRVHPEVVLVPNGWPGEANANLLTDPDKLDPISGFPAFRSAACRIEKI